MRQRQSKGDGVVAKWWVENMKGIALLWHGNLSRHKIERGGTDMLNSVILF